MATAKRKPVHRRGHFNRDYTCKRCGAAIGSPRGLSAHYKAHPSHMPKSAKHKATWYRKNRKAKRFGMTATDFEPTVPEWLRGPAEGAGARAMLPTVPKRKYTKRKNPIVFDLPIANSEKPLRFCTNCGMGRGKTWIFCGGCGHKLVTS